MTITHHPDIIQGSDEWHALRCGLLTASEVKLILTPTLKLADNEKTRAHVWEIAAQRITGYTEPSYIGDDMLRGWEDEAYARAAYEAHTKQPVTEAGFVTNDQWGFTIGYSPDGLVGDDGLIECKSRRQKFQVQTVVEWARGGGIPSDFVLQCQTGLLVTGRKWLHFVSYSGGMRMPIIRVTADEAVQEAIVAAATAFEARVAEAVAEYEAASGGFPMTERRVEQEMHT